MCSVSGWMEILDSRHALMQKNYRGLDVENAVVAIRDSIAADNSEVVFFRMQSGRSDCESVRRQLPGDAQWLGVLCRRWFRNGSADGFKLSGCVELAPGHRRR